MLQLLTPLQAGVIEILFLLLFLIVPLVVAVLWAAVAFWVYKDAQNHAVDSPALWAAVVFFAGLIGIVVYLLVRD